MRVIQSLLLVTATILTAHCIVIKPDCAATLCLRPKCNDNQELVTLDGECCPTCQPKSSTLPPPGQIDCSAVLCLRPECLDNQKLVTPEGQCCPKCVSTTEDCPFEGQVRAICEPCETTCIQFRNGNQRICPAICRLTNSSCECPGGQIVDIVNRRCVSPNECPNPCATVDCLPNSICKVDASGEAFCEPSCSLNNGGCLKNQTCSLEDVQCVRAPCPPVIKCTYDPCSECTANQICRRTVAPCLVPPCPETTQCLDRKAVCLSPPVTGPCRARFLRYFYNNTSGQCERFVYGGCQGNANNFLTSEACGNDCQVSVSPVSPCALIFCANGFRCEVSGGEGFCQPDCSLNNGGCLKDETCRLEDVTCVTTPCPKSRICDKPPTTPPCPPTCTKDFCRRRGNRKALCSKPGPRELPGCTGSCNLSYCSACYFSDNFVSTLPGNCSTCPLSDYTSDTRCFRHWASCTGYAHWRIHGRPRDRSQENFKCYSPPCPLRG